MYYKTFRYRVLPTKMGEYLALRQQADAVYVRHFGQSPSYLQSAKDQYQWLEIYSYADEASYRASMEQLQQDPEVERLWTQFRTVLDPRYHAAVDEYRSSAASNGQATEPWSDFESSPHDS